MELKNMPKEELELLSYTDLTEIILKDKPLKTPEIFRIICDLLGYSDSEYADKIGDYYTSLTTDKRFIFLDTNEWDLKEKHSVKIILDDDIDDELEEVDEIIEEEEEVEEDIDTVIDDDIDDDDMDDLSVLSEDEIEEE